MMTFEERHKIYIYLPTTHLKGGLTQDFQLQVFFMNQCPPGP
jgi:hypothetical protein